MINFRISSEKIRIFAENKRMNANHNIDTAKAYFEGMLSAAYGVKAFCDSVPEWQ